MGIHTSIYRERSMPVYGRGGYEIKLFRNEKELKLENPVLLREEFYFGKSVWAINEWFYQRILRRNKEYDVKAGEDFSHEYIHDENLSLSDFKDFLRDIEKVLENHNLAEKVLPMPRDLVLVKAKESTYDEKERTYVMHNDEDWENVPREEMYDDYYFKSLDHTREILEQLIREDGEELISDYVLEVC